jgi:fimbrial isopeptide formation D2 family protein/LPXTG-motif cell wall-anchored protein
MSITSSRSCVRAVIVSLAAIGTALAGTALVGVATAAPASATVNGVEIAPGVRLYSDVLRGDISATGAWGGGFNSMFNTINRDRWINRDNPNQALGVTTSKTSATLPLPADATIKRAFLFVAALNNGDGRTGSDVASVTGPNNVSNTYTTAVESDIAAVYNTEVRAFDISAQAVAAGAGEYTVQSDRVIGWWIVASFESPTAAWRRVVIDLPIQYVSSNKVAMTIGGLTTPTSGTVKATIGMGAIWGSAASGASNQFTFCPSPVSGNCPVGSFAQTQALTGRNGINPYGTITRTPADTDLYPVVPNGAELAEVRPTFGTEMDATSFNADGALPPGTTSARLELDAQTGVGDNAVQVYSYLSVELQTPDYATSVKTFTNTSSTVSSTTGNHVGDVLEFTLKLANGAAGDNSLNTVVTDTLPAGLEYVAGSSSITDGANVGAKTDAAADDQVDVVGRALTWRVGTDANGISGGTVSAGSEHVLKYKARIAAVGPGAWTNTMNIAGDGALTEVHFTEHRSVEIPVTVTAATSQDTNSVFNVLGDVPAGSPALNSASITVVTAPAHGTASADTATGVITYVPTSGYAGPDSYSYRVCDSAVPTPTCSTATVSLTVTFVGQDDTAVTSFGQPVVIDVGTNDGLPGTVTVTAVSAPAHGTATITGSTPGAAQVSAFAITGNTITYVPDAGYAGEDSFTYTACDDDGGCATRTVTVNVQEQLRAIELPATGGDVGGLLAAAFGCLLVGAAAIVASRRRNGACAR